MTDELVIIEDVQEEEKNENRCIICKMTLDEENSKICDLCWPEIGQH